MVDMEAYDAVINSKIDDVHDDVSLPGREHTMYFRHHIKTPLSQQYLKCTILL